MKRRIDGTNCFFVTMRHGLLLPCAYEATKALNHSRPKMKTLLLVYHSTTGATAQMANAAAEAAKRIECAPGETKVSVRLLHASEAGPADLLGADAYIFASPENLAAIAGLMKDFFDRSYYAVLDQINGRRFGLIVCAGSDGTNAVRQIERIATGWRLQAAHAPIIVCTRAQSTEAILAPKCVSASDLARAEELGATMAAGLALGAF